MPISNSLACLPSASQLEIWNWPGRHPWIEKYFSVEPEPLVMNTHVCGSWSWRHFPQRVRSALAEERHSNLKVCPGGWRGEDPRLPPCRAGYPSDPEDRFVMSPGQFPWEIYFPSKVHKGLLEVSPRDHPKCSFPRCHVVGWDVEQHSSHQGLWQGGLHWGPGHPGSEWGVLIIHVFPRKNFFTVRNKGFWHLNTFRQREAEFFNQPFSWHCRLRAV